MSNILSKENKSLYKLVIKIWIVGSIILVLCNIVFEPTLLQSFYHLPSEAISAITGLLGVLAGVLLTNLYQRRNERKEKRIKIIHDYLRLITDYQAQLNKIDLARTSNDTNALRQCKIDEFRFSAEFGSLNVRVLEVFDNVWIRAASQRVFSSFELITKNAYADEVPNAKFYETCQAWLNHQLQEIFNLLMPASGLPLRWSSSFAFVGFRKVKYDDKQRLSSDIDAPPWLPLVALHFSHENGETERKRKLKEDFLGKFNGVFCPDHGNAPRIVIEGKSSESYKIMTTSCCEEFGLRINSIITGKETR